MVSAWDRERALQRELEPGERVAWSGQPAPRRAWLQALPTLIFGIPWTAFAVFWTATAAYGVSRPPSNGPWLLFPLFGVPFILIGVGLLTSPLWALRRAARTVYAVTDRRALIIVEGFIRSVKSYTPRDVVDIERRERADGSGDLLFAWGPTYRSTSGTSTAAPRPGFYGVPDVRGVERAVVAMLEQGGRAIERMPGA